MKKIFILMISLVMVFALTACSTKKKEEGSKINPTDNTEKKNSNTEKKDEPKDDTKLLYCSKDFSEQMSNNIGMEQEVFMKFKSNKIESMVMSMNFELPSNLASASDTFISTMKKTYDDKYGNKYGVDVELEKESETEFSIIISLDFGKMSASDKKDIGFAGSEDFTVNKNSFIRQGYECE